jgi:hypothetical protein
MTKFSRWFLAAVLVCGSSSDGLPASPWDGTWSGSLKTGDAVSVTISDGKVIAYAFRGAAPYGIEYSRVTTSTVAFGDRRNYSVKLFRRNERTAFGTAHSPFGDGFASLTRQ